MRNHVLRALVVAAGLGVGLASAPEDVRIVAVEGEGAKYWPQWRGPSAQGHVVEAKYTDTWSSTSGVCSGR